MRGGAPRLAARLGWFAGLWLASVLALAAIGLLIRTVLAP